MKALRFLISSIAIMYYQNSNAQIFEPEKMLSRPRVNIPQKVIAADVDNDGLMDIVVAGITPDNLSWFKNLGDAVFGDKQIIYTSSQLGTYTCSVLSKDVDADGDDDLIAYDYQETIEINIQIPILQQCYWIENLGAGNFGERQIINVDTTVLAYFTRNFYLADFDGDGLEDLVYGTSSTWNKYLGSGNWASAEPIMYINQPISGNYYLEDVNQDGKAEIIGNLFSNPVIGISIEGNQIDSIIQLTDYNLEFNDLACTDLDQDGLKDLVVCKKTGLGNYFYFLKNLDNNQFGDTVLIYQQTQVSEGIGELESADFNDDGLNDLVLFTDRICLFINAGNAQFYPPTFYHKIGFKIISADLNNDILTDIVGLENDLGTGFVTAKKFDLNNFFYNTESICLDDRSYFPNVTDIDFDGDLDIYFKSGWYECLGTNPIEYSRFKWINEPLNNNFLNYLDNIIGIYDFNNDGLKDFIIHTGPNDSLTVLLNNLSGILTDIIYFPLPFIVNSKRFCEFDFNQDGINDFVLFTNNFSPFSAILFFKKNTLGIIELSETKITSSSYYEINSFRFSKLFDINADNQLDLLVASGEGLQCFVNTGSGIFEDPFLLVNESIYNFYLEDINGDELKDLVFSGYNIINGLNTIKAKIGLQDNQFSEPFDLLDDNLYFGDFSLFDFDLDGDPDILTKGVNVDTSYTLGGGAALYYLENLNGMFINDSVVVSKYDINRVFTADLDGDFDFDFFTSYSDFSRTLFINNTNKVTFNIENADNTKILVYPNPLINSLNIKFKEIQEKVDVDIFTIDGKLINTINFNDIESTQINLNLNAGMYLVRLKTNNEIITRKIIKN